MTVFGGDTILRQAFYLTKWPLLVTVLCAGLVMDQTFPTHAAFKAEGHRSNSTLVRLRNGGQALDIKWAIGHTDNVVTLRIPREYWGPLMGPTDCARAVEPAPGDDCAYPYLVEFLVDASLPDFGPIGSQGAPGQIDLTALHIEVASTVRASARTPDEILGEDAANIIEFMHEQLKHVAPLPDSYGLHVIGPDFSVPISLQVPPLIGEVYYDRSLPEKSTTYIRCGNDRLNNILDASSVSGDQDLCDEAFSIPDLRAIVHTSFYRAHIGEWRAIKQGISRMLTSFVRSK